MTVYVENSLLFRIFPFELCTPIPGMHHTWGGFSTLKFTVMHAEKQVMCGIVVKLYVCPKTYLSGETS